MYPDMFIPLRRVIIYCLSYANDYVSAYMHACMQSPTCTIILGFEHALASGEPLPFTPGYTALVIEVCMYLMYV